MPDSPRFSASGAAQQRGFSLVEIVLAVGVVSFAFVAILGLLPAGMTQFRQAIDTSVCAAIGQRVIMDAQQTDFDVLTDWPNLPKTGNGTPQANLTFRAPKFNDPAWRYFDEQGNEVVPKSGGTLSAAERALVVYHVNTRIRPETTLPRASGQDSADICTVTVEVAFNPGNKTLVTNPLVTSQSSQSYPVSNLIKLSDAKNAGVTVKTYSAQISRNQ